MIVYFVRTQKGFGFGLPITHGALIFTLVRQHIVCVFKYDALKVLLHTLQTTAGCGFNESCDFMWTLRYEIDAKAFGHFGQANGCSPL